jgi:L-ascorbate metabolism protein UlaG (beta-lactamase superfamily)
MTSNNETVITWFGHSTFRIDTPGGKSLLIDPFLQGNPVCPEELHDPMNVDAVFLTHGHFDHIDDAPRIAIANSAPVVCMFDLSDWLASEGVEEIIGFNLGGTIDVAGIRASMVEARHSSSLASKDGVIYGGLAVGYILEMENGFKIYVAGDTSLFMDMAMIGELYEPDLGILPIGDHFTMNGQHAARACQLLGLQHVIPCHYGTFPSLASNANALTKAAAEIADLQVHVLKPGESLRRIHAE